MLSQKDMAELKRMSTNLYGDDKETINRIIKGIAELLSSNRRLIDENKALKEVK